MRVRLGKIWGWRLFNLNKLHQVVSLTAREEIASSNRWDLMPRQAWCSALACPRDHEERYMQWVNNSHPTGIPEHTCGCGFYYFEDFDQLLRHGTSLKTREHLVALVQSWGKTVQHQWGYRSQFQQIQLLWTPWTYMGGKIPHSKNWDLNKQFGSRLRYYAAASHQIRTQFQEGLDLQQKHNKEIWIPYSEVPTDELQPYKGVEINGQHREA